VWVVCGDGRTYAQTALPTACAIVVFQRTDNLELIWARKIVGSGRHARRVGGGLQQESQWGQRLGVWSLGLDMTMVVESS
jgi:hypothetical protein